MTNAFTASFVTGSNVNGSVGSALSGAVSATVTGPYYVDLSTGSSGLQASYVNTTLTYNTANNALGCTNVSASLYGTSSWATNAFTNSFGTGIPQIQAGIVNYFGGATGSLITFNKAFPNTNYVVNLMGTGSYGPLTGSYIKIPLLTTGFTASFGNFSGSLMWYAISFV